MKIIQSMIIALSMYSTVPMPRVDWNKENMKYALCFFPLVGVIIGLALLLWVYMSKIFNIGNILFSVVAVIIPIAISGGIHVDGFCDTVDALSSHQNKERKLEILKDPNIGAFALIGCVLYILFNFGLYTQLKINNTFIILSIGFILSRAFSGFSIVTFNCAKNSGLASTFSNGAEKTNVRVTMLFYIVACIGAMLVIDYVLAIACVVAIGGAFIYYRVISYKEFGGITGDLAGYFLQIAEMAMLIAVVIVGVIRV